MMPRFSSEKLALGCAHVMNIPPRTFRRRVPGIPHFQFRISGMSRPCLSMYSLCSMSLSWTICFQVRPLVAHLRQPIDHILHQRWDRSGSLSTVMSKAVVIVPSSL